MITNIRAAFSCLLLLLAFTVHFTNAQQVKFKTVVLTPDDRAHYKFLPLEDGSRLRLQGGLWLRSGLSPLLTLDEKKTKIHLYLGATSESKSKVWLQVQFKGPGNTKSEGRCWN